MLSSQAKKTERRTIFLWSGIQHQTWSFFAIGIYQDIKKSMRIIWIGLCTTENKTSQWVELTIHKIHFTGRIRGKGKKKKFCEHITYLPLDISAEAKYQWPIKTHLQNVVPVLGRQQRLRKRGTFSSLNETSQAIYFHFLRPIYILQNDRKLQWLQFPREITDKMSRCLILERLKKHYKPN